jgi:hypothetical protein
MADDYDPAENSRKSYDVAIDAMRDKLASFRCERVGDATLYLGDCREILPLLPKVDAVVTDPPYGIGAAKMRLGNGFKKYEIGGGWDDAPADITMINVKDVPAIIWGGNYFPMPPCRGPLVWDKAHGAGVDFADVEVAWTNLDQVARRITHRPMNMDGGKVHPTQKPIAVMEWCLGFLPKARTILDPFMGSGTTGVACAKLGRKFIGIELEPKYFDIAVKRIDDAYRQPRLFKDEPSKPKQEALL